MNIHLRDGSTTEDARLGRLVEADWRGGNITVPVRDAALVEPVE